MKCIFTTPFGILKKCLLCFLFSVSFHSIAQEEDRFGCGSVPMEDAYLQDPFYGNSKALMDILREAG